MKFLPIIIVATLMLSGCGTTRDNIVYKDKYIPIPYVPHPPVIDEQVYYASTLTDEQRDQLGELSKAYVISSKEAVNEAAKLRLMYTTYVRLAENSERRLEAIENMGGVVDRSLVDQANREVQRELQALSIKFETQDEELSNNVTQSLNQMGIEP